MNFVKSIIKSYLDITGLKERIDSIVNETVSKEIKLQTNIIAQDLLHGRVPWRGETKELSAVLTRLVKDSTNELAEKKVVELVAEAIEETGIDTEAFLDRIVTRLKAKQLD